MRSIEVLKKNKEYRRVYNRGRLVADRFLVLYYAPNSLEIKRFGFTVSKKVGKAVVRNRIRRLFKEACRLNKDSFPDGFDYVVLARRDVAGQGYAQVEDSLKKLLRKMRNNVLW